MLNEDLKLFLSFRIPELLTIIENEVTKEKNKSGNIEERKLDKQIIPWNG